MKKLIQIIIILALGAMVQQCRNYENFEIYEEPQFQAKTTNNHAESDTIRHEHMDMDPDPPVRDGQDWKY